MSDYITKNASGAFHYRDGKLHNEHGPAIITTYGDKFWYINGKRHREDGPACELISGGKLWYVNDKPHRLDGPAMEFGSGGKIWCVSGVRMEEQEFLRRTQDTSLSSPGHPQDTTEDSP